MTQTQVSPTIALTSTWLDATFNANTPSQMQALYAGSAGSGINNCVVTTWPQYQPGIWWYPYNGPSRPVRLGLPEIQRLKAAAKRDAKLKAILEKFTDLIEVAVDFE